MSTMSYCMFENTLRDLKDCAEALDHGKDLSDSEQAAFVEMIELCSDLARGYKHVLKNAA